MSYSSPKVDIAFLFWMMAAFLQFAAAGVLLVDLVINH